MTDHLGPVDPPDPAPVSSLVYCEGVALPALVALPPLELTARMGEQIALMADEGAPLDGALVFVRLPCTADDHGDDMLLRADAIRAILPHRTKALSRGERPGNSDAAPIHVRLHGV